MQVLLNSLKMPKFSEEEGEIFIMLHRTNQWVEVIVRDNGPGIPQKINKEYLLIVETSTTFKRQSALALVFQFVEELLKFMEARSG